MICFDAVSLGIQDRYGIRFEDNSGGGDGDDRLELGVRRGEDGILRVQYRKIFGGGAPAITLAQSLLTTAPGDDQILFRLERASLLSNDITASFDLLDGGLVTFSHTFLTAGDSRATIFNGENWTRATFVATERLSVPEPSTLALFGCGLLGLLARRRRKS